MNTRLQFGIALSALLIPVLSNADGIRNGSFTQGNYVKNGEGWMNVKSGPMIISGWVVTGNVDWVDTDWRASDGKRSIDLSGWKPGSITQVMETTLGKTYRILFDLAGNVEGGPNLKEMTVSEGGHATHYKFDTTGHTNQHMGWITKVFEFRATSHHSKIKFSSLTNTSYGPVICHVRSAPTRH